MQTSLKKGSAEPQAAGWYRFTFRFAGPVAMAMGGLALLGWLLGIRILTTVIPGSGTIKPNTALCFIVAGLSLWLLRLPASPTVEDNPSHGRLAQICALFVAVLGVLTLAEHLLHLNLGIDQRLLRDTFTNASLYVPGRMSIATASGFCMLGASLFFLAGKAPLDTIISQCLALIVLIDAGIGCTGYTYVNHSLYAVSLYTTMAAPTAVLFVFLGFAALFARPDRGLISAITSEYGGGQMARHILPWVVTLPFLIGWLRLKGEQAGLYGTEFGLALSAVSNIIIFTLLVWIGAWSLNTRTFELARSNHRFRFLADTMPQLIWTAKPDGNIDYTNQRWLDYAGLTLEQIKNRGWTSAVHPDDLQNCVARWTKAFSTDCDYEVECRLKRGLDGSYRWHLGRAFPLRDETGSIVQWVGTCTDIEDQKQAGYQLEQRVAERTAELTAAQGRLQAVLDAATEVSIVAADAEGLITVFNAGAEQMLGYTSEEMVGKLSPRIFHLESEVLARGVELSEAAGKPVQGNDVFVERARNGQHEEREWTYVRKDGRHLTVNLVVTVSRDASGKIIGYLGVAMDITARKKAQAELREADARRESFVLELKRRNLEITLLGRMGDLLLSCLSVKEARAIIGDFAKLLFPSGSGALYLLDAARENLHLEAHWGAPPSGEIVFRPEQCFALRRGKIYSVHEGSRGLVCEHLGSGPADGTSCLPMAAQGDVLGVVSVGGKIYDELSKTFVEQITLALASLKLREILRSQSIRDPLTGLFNRRFMEESLDRELKRATRNGRPLGAILIDVDHFKNFNDAFGHDVGDAVLKEVGAFLLSNTRGSDIACRYGGEEFAVIMPEASLDITVERAGQLQQKIKLLDFRNCGIGSKTVTFSLGVAAVPDHGSSMASLLKVADTALYKAKADGRDRVVRGASAEP
jgi:diguanylate cyclase (GGDEF)-like protein/PAS domain S-box-containing protein